MNRIEAQALMQRIGAVCNLPDEGREGVLWVDDVDRWVVGVKGVAVAVSPEPLNGKQILNSIRLAIDDKKEIHVTSKDNKAVLIIYTPLEGREVVP